jgi:hypothetical protein
MNRQTWPRVPAVSAMLVAVAVRFSSDTQRVVGGPPAKPISG